jgi:hypothetical protein
LKSPYSFIHFEVCDDGEADGSGSAIPLPPNSIETSNLMELKLDHPFYLESKLFQEDQITPCILTRNMLIAKQM